MNEFLRLIRLARPHRVRLAGAIAAMLLYAGATAKVGLLVQPIFDVALSKNGAAPDAGVFSAVGKLALAILAAFFAKGVGAFASDYLMTDVGQRVVMDLRTRLFGHILGQSAGFFARHTSGQLLSRVTNDVGQVQRAVSETAGDLIRESMSLVGYVGVMFYYDVRLALICLTAAPLVVYPLVRLGQRVRGTTRLGQEAMEQVTHVAAEGFTGQRIVKAFGAEAREVARFARASLHLFRTNMKVTSALAVLPPLMEFIGGVALVGALVYGSREIQAGQLTAGAFSGFLYAAFMMYAPIKRLSRVNANIQQALAASARIFEVLDLHTEVAERPRAVALPRVRETVEFRDVGFAYDDHRDRFVVQHVSFTVRVGQIVAIVGLSGAGKTTLVSLIPRFYDVREGAILMDGVDIRDATLRSLRDQVALVTQETVLFDDTIAANIAYGAPGATPEAIEAAARAAHAHEFIARLPHAYDATIGERGQRLSGGQRQRVAIARAILKNCPLLILDEATSALDTESELLVQDALANLMRHRTTFVIAHRLSTIRHADLVVALEKGRVAEMGTHDDLVARPGGVYARLYALQMLDDRQSDVERGSSRRGARL